MDVERQAKKAVGDSDCERNGFFLRFHNVRQELPTHYNLAGNNDCVQQ